MPSPTEFVAGSCYPRVPPKSRETRAAPAATTAAPAASKCIHCMDGHEDPRRRPWAVYVDAVNLDHDGQPVRLIVAKTGGQHVAESDAEWLRQVIREARGDRS